MSTAHRVCAASELPPGDRRIVEINGRSIGVFNVDGEFYALTNVCPHQRAPLCAGELTGTTEADGVDDVKWTRNGRILRCPWHGWEFDVTSGESVFNPHRWRVSTYETDVLVDPCADDSDLAVETYPVDTEDGVVYVYPE
ncbi:Rieske (2Fe-2S) protein [Halomontanus rarus]|uniref:Rieske (2Fe-2S) protein n=1 Tax=Halomontanus rarus TaxID=3034020 RepID=UPI0023E8AE6F|nr:Rieske (2Fe-2S) protein [Halovivax sp. TS33]